jgi:hypothetical protein
MIRRILILGASYGSLFGTKLLMAVHDVTSNRMRNSRPWTLPDGLIFST